MPEYITYRAQHAHHADEAFETALRLGHTIHSHIEPEWALRVLLHLINVSRHSSLFSYDGAALDRLHFSAIETDNDFQLNTHREEALDRRLSSLHIAVHRIGQDDRPPRRVVATRGRSTRPLGSLLGLPDAESD